MVELGRELDHATEKLNEAESVCKDFVSVLAKQKRHTRHKLIGELDSYIKEANKWRSICATIQMKQEPFFKAFKFHVQDSSKL